MRNWFSSTTFPDRLARVGATLVLLAAAAPALDAQVASPPRNVITTANPGERDLTLQRRGRGFDLFANGDLAGTGMKMTGEHGWGLSNIGPCADGFALFQCGDIQVNGTYRFNWFELNLTAGVPFSDFRKIRSVHPGASTMLPPAGFTHLITSLLITGRQEWGPADGSIGRLFSGETSTSDGSCRDNTSPLNGYMTTGIQLLAGSTCPQTWPGSGFAGQRVITDSAFIRLFQRDPANFSFDQWKIPASDPGRTNEIIGDFSTYGEITDHYQEILAAYGGVTARGSGTPTIGGFPLGLEIRFDAFQFGTRPAIRNAIFYQMTIVNKSALLYGTGISYDSLYFGLMPGWGSGQQNAVYFRPEQNAVKVNESGTNPGCNGARIIAGAPSCGSSAPGFTSGAKGLVILKSPIGDARNKLLTNPASPFFNPSSEFADDTITFNHGRMCSFGTGCYNSTTTVNDRRGFGMISSTEANVLDGRDPSSLPPITAFRTFRSKNFNGQSDATTTRFNRYIPGNWDYNEDGTADTLYLDSCAESGCVVAWSDTMPGKQVNARANVGAVVTAGPFQLAAGDTTAFVFAIVGAPDSASFESLVRNTIDSYLNFYAGAQPFPVPTVVGTDVQSASETAAAGGNPEVRIFLSGRRENFVDPFFLKTANDLAGSALDRLNPTLLDSIRTVGASNLADLLVFKSCDNGATFTSDADCAGDPAVGPGGTPIETGWQPYRVLTPNANGQLPTVFVDQNVIGGRTYLYSFVTRTRGFTRPVRDVTASGDTIVRIFTLTDTIASPLARTGPTTALVYVPISTPAGVTGRTFTVNNVAGNATAPVTVQLAQNADSGTFRLVFGDRFIVRVRNDSTFVLVQDLIANAQVSGTNVQNFVVRQDSLATAGRINFAGATFTPDTTTQGGVRVLTDTITALGFVLARGNRPLFISTNIEGSETTPLAFFSRSDFPGFTLTVDQLPPATATRERLVRAEGDTLSNALLNANAVQVQDALTTLRGSGGLYQFRFRSEAYGPQSPFTLQAPNETDAVFDASLAQRTTGTIGDTTAAVRSVVGATIAAYNNRNFVPARFPFTVITPSGDTAILAMPSRAALGKTNTVLLGTGNDTIRVTVDSLQWVPGDEFVVLERVTVDSVAGGRVVIDPATSRPFQVQRLRVALGPTVLGCNTLRTSCNPLAFGTRGATGYLPYQDGFNLIIEYPRNFTSASELAVVIPPAAAARAFTRADLQRVRVVPNPYVFQSEFDFVRPNRSAESRVIFAGVPSEGVLRIYSVSGQFLQQLTWTAADLNGTGDLPYNLRTREGTELSSGLYIYVITARNENGGEQKSRGKFVVIR